MLGAWSAAWLPLLRPEEYIARCAAGLEASDPFGGENHSAEPRRPNGYGGAADGRSPAPPAGGYGPPADGYGPPANGYSPAADAYGTGGREPSAARDAPPPPAARVPEHREAAHMPRAYGNGLAPPPPNVQGGRALVSDAPPPGRDGGARDGHAGAARPGSGEQLDGREFFRRCRAHSSLPSRPSHQQEASPRTPDANSMSCIPCQAPCRIA